MSYSISGICCKPGFSVVIPLYNKKAHIKRCLESVLRQTIKPSEIIVVDDFSTDNGCEIVESFDSNLVRIIKHNNNRGVSCARNTGVMAAQYEFIAFLDADDAWSISFLEKIQEMILIHNNIHVFSTGWTSCFELKTALQTSDSGLMNKNRNEKILIIQNYFREAVKKDLICSSSVVVHNSVFFRSGIFDPNVKYGEDIDLWLRISLWYEVCINTGYYSYYYIDAENRAGIGPKAKRLDFSPFNQWVYFFSVDRKYLIKYIKGRFLKFHMDQLFRSPGENQVGKSYLLPVGLINKMVLRLLDFIGPDLRKKIRYIYSNLKMK